MSSQLSCGICNKTFTKRQSQIRHTSYCRRKLRDPLPPRKKSCSRCILAKTSCDKARPACSRCVKFGRDCHYELAVRSVLPSPSDGCKDFFSDETSFSALQPSFWPPVPIEDALLISDFVPTAAAFDNLDLRGNDSTVLPPGDLYNMAHNELLIDQYTMTETKTRPQMLEISRLPGFDYSLCAAQLVQPKPLYLSSNLPAQFLLSTLAEYPRRLLKSRAPPFIHQHVSMPRSASAWNTTAGIPPPKILSRGIELTHFWARGRREEVWQLAQHELLQIQKEVSTYNDVNTVAASQAACIYLLLRVERLESAQPASQFDTVLRRALLSLTPRNRALKEKYSDVPLYPSATIDDTTIDCRQTWQLWILLESLHRSIHTILIVDCIAQCISEHNKVGCATEHDWFGVRLPCSRYLWEARSPAEWMEACEEWREEPTLTFGDLVWSSQAQEGRHKRALERWMGEADELGTLLVTVAGVLEAKWRG
ncbi:hypothetical protein BDY17DRAFT_182957 [Neohortaea acidophila]|uniref:Zn(2)-C6 fungal-type domain-containing protein n=1 Tax=Neohortaea acidophila TaxID=245834 RepID=A0A6A6PMR7_9PEZI|nr:uncharacterized protein BDY17DRAFT_182957 [Neohortaea acidophila]KAF2481116.1 hypothetical protein BDY17DRAFT_182957 [Neohortaea acidophila]